VVIEWWLQKKLIELLKEKLCLCHIKRGYFFQTEKHKIQNSSNTFSDASDVWVAYKTTD
jgi:hypothetical protein